MSEEKNKVTVNIIKKANPSKDNDSKLSKTQNSVSNETVESKKKVVVKVKTQAKPVLKVKEAPVSSNNDKKIENKSFKAGDNSNKKPSVKVNRNDQVIDGKAFMGNSGHLSSTRIQSTIHSGPVIIHASETVKEETKVDNTRPRVQGIVGGRPTGQRQNNYQRGNNYRSQNGDRPFQKRDSSNQGNFKGGRSYSPDSNNKPGFNRSGNNGKPSFNSNRFSSQRTQPTGAQTLELNQKNGARKTPVSSNRKKDKDNKWDRDEEVDFALAKKKKEDQKRAAVPDSIDIMENITVADLAKKMNLKASDIISKLFKMGMMVTINQQIDHETAEIIASEYGCTTHLVSLYDETVIETEEDKEEDLIPRPPIVTIMGHVDHGKTKTLDAIRQTNVVASEYGGITQHIGAYKVTVPNKGEIVFLDTPGHAAFSMMRARGAQVTDIVVLVVAANDGVMPQTREAVDHAKAANVPIIVAINKCDLAEAKPERVMQQLSDLGLMPEAWGGTTLYCQISALTKTGITDLLDTILLQAEMLELKANPNCRAVGKVLESKIDQGRGTVATVLVQKGTLKQGDYFVAGIYSGRVRAMFDDTGRKILSAGPSTPVEIIGLSNIPSAGDPFQVTEDEKTARSIALKRQELERLGENNNRNKVTLENFNEKIKEGQVTDFNVIIKGDVQGSVEALTGVLEKLSTDEIKLNVIRASAGAIIESDITLASASQAIVIGFNVRPTPRAQALANEEKVEIKKYNIIYDVVDDIKAAMEGLLSPETKEVDIGKVEVRDTFKVPKVGLIAGCMVIEGKVKRNSLVRVIRDSIQINKDMIKISSLKRFKDDAKEVLEGFECGLGLENWQDLQVGDILEIVETEEVKRTLEFNE